MEKTNKYWRSVEDQVPEIGEGPLYSSKEVLIYFRWGNKIDEVSIATGYYRDYNYDPDNPDFQWCLWGRDGYTLSGVEFWRPLPPGPYEEE